MLVMFQNCYNLSNIKISSSFNTNNAIIMGGIFFGCNNLLGRIINKINKNA